MVRGVVCSLLWSVVAFISTEASAQNRNERENLVSARDLATLADLDGLSVSPDGTWVAFQTRTPDPDRNAFEVAWSIVSVANPRLVRKVGDAGDPIFQDYLGRQVGTFVVNSATWSPDGRWLAVIRREGNDTQIWRIGIAEGEERQLTHNSGAVVGLVFSRDGERILFETAPSRRQIDAALAEEGLRGFRYDNRFFPAYSLTPTLPADVSFADMTRAESASQLVSRQVWALDLSTGEERSATASEAREFQEGRREARSNAGEAYYYFSARSGAGAVAWTDAQDPRLQGALAPLSILTQSAAGAQPVACVASECRSQVFSGLWWGSEGELVFARREGRHLEETALYSWRLDGRAVRLILRTTAQFAGKDTSSCSVAGRELVCFYETAQQPRRLVAISLDSGNVRVLHDPNPAFQEFDLGSPPERITVVASDGIEASGLLVLPPTRAARPLPLIVVTYRCSGFLRGGTGDEYPIFAFAAQGFAVLCFDTPDTDRDRLARLSAAEHSNWRRGPGDPVRHRVQNSLNALVSALSDRGIVDERRVGLTGLSFGGETVAYALFSMPNLSVAIASGLGFEPSDLYLYGPSARERYRAWGLSSSATERWAALSLSRNARNVRAPLLLNLPDREVLASLSAITALQEVDAPVEVFVYPDEYHIKWQPMHRLSIYERNLDWMNYWLRNNIDADPNKAEQYERWEQMRLRVRAEGELGGAG